jgi:uncharacterized protein YkwD
MFGGFMPGTQGTRRRVHRGTVVAALIVTAALLLCSAMPAQATMTGSEQHMGWHINSTRAAAGRHSLHLSTPISDIARRHSYAMATSGGLYHSNLSYVLRNYSWSLSGENVGVGPSLDAVFKAFMNSPPHKANILYRSYERVGIGVYYRNGYYWVTFIFSDYD